MQPDYRTQENTPENKRHAAEEIKPDTQHGQWYPVPFADPVVKLVLAEIRHIRQQLVRFGVHGFARDDPAHVCPDTAIARRMRVAFFIRILVMLTMRSYPGDGSALERQRSARGEEVLHPFRRLVATMRQQAVVA